MSGTAKYEQSKKAATAKGPWVLLQAWPSNAVVPVPIAAPFGRAHLEKFGCCDEQVSAEHCQIYIREDGLDVVDASSTNGTWVEGRRVSRAMLREGSILRVGGALFVVRRSSLRQPQPQIDGGTAGALVGPFGLQRVRRAIREIARNSPSNVLITGETGTGKEALAHHVASVLGCADPFETVNAAAYRSDSFDAAFFGYERGAFTGAAVAHAGIVGAAEGGTLFLDELGDMPLEFQPLLLRFIETREVRRLGVAHTTIASVAVVAATHHDLERAVDTGRFREDLLARFDVPRLHLPPLRERAEDIPAIAVALAERAGWSLAAQADIVGIERLMMLPLKRNVRQLRARMEDARTAGGVVQGVVDELHPLRESLDDSAICVAVAEEGSERQAALALGISRRQVRNALARGARTADRGSRTDVDTFSADSGHDKSGA